MSENIEGSGFVIKDKRHSQKTDEQIQQEENSTPPENAETDSKPNKQDFEIDFSTFILSLTSSAFYHLGDIADPQSGEKKVDLVAVKQTIDILIMLKDKTKGNLKDDENKLLEQLIYELQMKYVAKNK